MSRFSKILLVVLALALWAGTANAQSIVAGTPTVTLTYTPGGVNTTSGTSAISDSGSSNTYSTSIQYNSGSNWLSTLTSLAGGFPVPDTLQIPLNTVTAATMAAGSYSATITVTDSDSVTDTATITVNLTVTASLSAGALSNTSLTWVFGEAGPQAASTATVVVSNTDASYDTFTVAPSVANCPAWLSVVGSPVGPPLQAKSSTSNTLTFSINSANFGGATTANITNCTVQLQYNGAAFATLSFAKLAIVSQPLLATSPTFTLAYSKGTNTATQATTSVTISVAKNTSSTVFTLDLATMPPWLSVSSGLAANGTANATFAGNAVTFAVNTTIAAGMASGNYVANVGFYAAGFSDLLVPIALQVSNATPSVTLVPNSNQTAAITSSANTPTPVWTLYSSDEPVPFTATCTVQHSALTYTPTAGFATPCLLNGAAGSSATNVVNGTTFTWGYTLTGTLDPALFTATIGNTVTAIVTFTGLSSAPGPVSYQYTLAPGLPTLATTTSPSTISANFSKTDSAVVLLKGTNFLGAGSISGSSVVQTQVWVGTNLLTSANASSVASYVVVNASLIAVTLAPGTLPTVSAGKTGTVVFGVANQTGLAAPTASTATVTLNVTNSPVIYAMTDTASFVQPAAMGGSPSFAPYELISIFGDNFGLTGSNTASATFDSYGKVVTPMVLTAAAGSAKATTLAVTFTSGKTTLTAPVLFSNQNQINAIVPSGIVVGTAYTVGVTAAGLSSDGLFSVNTVAADPGVFTLLSDGTGPGAIINQNGTINSSNSATTKAHASDIISIYLTGLGVPDSTGVDAATTNPTAFPTTCVAISDTTANSPGLLQVVNTKVGTTYASPAWTSIDGATMIYGAHDIILGTVGDLNYPPCMATAAITVVFGTATNQVVSSGSAIQYAGFVSGSVAGLYQINVQIPASLTPQGGTVLSGTTPVQVTITPSGGSTYTSQPGVTIVFP